MEGTGIWNKGGAAPQIQSSDVKKKQVLNVEEGVADT
jgi:hypothetical protein